jgi:hypothetical protein
LEASSTRAIEAAAIAIAFALVMLAPGDALAQGSATAGRPDELFAQGKALLEAHDFAHACPKLSESYALDPAPGTLLALAICHEGMGRTATAWRELRDVVESATREGRADRARFARSEIAKLDARLSRLDVVAPAPAAPGLKLEVDGAALAPEDWGKAAPVDPGRHIVTARAPGFKPWTGTADVGAEHDSQTLTVGPLEVDPGTAPAPPPVRSDVVSPAPSVPSPAEPAAPAAPGGAEEPAAAPNEGAWKRPAAWIAGGVGIAALGVGTYFGVSAITKSSDAKSKCSPSLCVDPAAVRENGDAKTAATVSDVAIGAGLAAVAAGVYLFLSAPSAPGLSPGTASLRITPTVGRQQLGIAFDRVW